MHPDEEALLSLHRELVAIPSVSHEEGAVADFIEGVLRRSGADVVRLENNLLARAGQGRRVLLNSHFDTVPASGGWTHDPWKATREEDRIYGLGSNDAKASVAAMIETFLGVAAANGPCDVALMLVAEEETGGRGTEIAWPHLCCSGFDAESVVVGEPTGLQIAIAQKGLLILELIEEGDACHAAHAQALNARNAVRQLARDLVALEELDLGPDHPVLGATTLEPTVTVAGTRRNVIPDRASTYLDLRTAPGLTPSELAERVQKRVKGIVRIHSERFLPFECPRDAPIVGAAQAAAPNSHLFGSRTLSDLVHFRGYSAIKCGPGLSERSHTPDEFVLGSEVIAGAVFYKALLRELG